jgi:hypothetical protein
MKFLHPLLTLIISITLVHMPLTYADNGIEIETEQKLADDDPEGCSGWDTKDQQCIGNGLRYNCLLNKCVSDEDHTDFTNEYRSCDVQYAGDDKRTEMCKGNLTSLAKAFQDKERQFSPAMSDNDISDGTDDSLIWGVAIWAVYGLYVALAKDVAACKPAVTEGEWNLLAIFGVVIGLYTFFTHKQKKDAESAFSSAIAEMESNVKNDQVGWKNGGQKAFLESMKKSLNAAKSAAEEKIDKHNEVAMVMNILTVYFIVAWWKWNSIAVVSTGTTANEIACHVALIATSVVASYMETEAASKTGEVLGDINAALSDLDLLISKFDGLSSSGGSGQTGVGSSGISNQSMMKAQSTVTGSLKGGSANSEVGTKSISLTSEGGGSEEQEELKTLVEENCKSGNVNSQLCADFVTGSPVTVSGLIGALEAGDSQEMQRIQELLNNEGVVTLDGGSQAALAKIKSLRNKSLKDLIDSEEANGKIDSDTLNTLTAALNPQSPKARAFLNNKALGGVSPLRAALAAHNAPMSSITRGLQDIAASSDKTGIELASVSGLAKKKKGKKKGFEINFGSKKPMKKVTKEKVGNLKNEHLRDDIGINKNKDISIWKAISTRYKILSLRKVFSNK